MRTLPSQALPAVLRSLAAPLLLAVLLAASGCGPQAGAPESAAFVTRLGDDTLAVEQFVRTDTGMEATVVLRTPQTTVQRYTLRTDGDSLTRFEASVHAPGAAADAPPVRTTVIVFEADSLVVEETDDGETRTRRVAAEPEVLPFLDMIHWPFELMLQRAVEAEADSLVQPLLTGRRTMPFVIRRIAPDSMTVTHPFRGTMRVQVDDRGRLLHLDAGATTRKLIVERVESVDVDGLARSFAARGSFGPLSSRGETVAEVDGATLSVDYGVPMKRGREIFGALVPWGELWRTGANRATHFTTDTDLVLGGLDVPAGTYTLYSIPAPDGGTLIVNTQTGQGGTTYNEDQDLGRIALQIGTLQETVEPFTIRIDDTEDGGLLRLQWDRTEFTVPFTVAD